MSKTVTLNLSEEDTERLLELIDDELSSQHEGDDEHLDQIRANILYALGEAK